MQNANGANKKRHIEMTVKAGIVNLHQNEQLVKTCDSYDCQSRYESTADNISVAAICRFQWRISDDVFVAHLTLVNVNALTTFWNYWSEHGVQIRNKHVIIKLLDSCVQGCVSALS